MAGPGSWSVGVVGSGMMMMAEAEAAEESWEALEAGAAEVLHHRRLHDRHRHEDPSWKKKEDAAAAAAHNTAADHPGNSPLRHP